ncbi:MAG: Crp/Fnr family transcriptional regulator, partial [Polaromonas sp.]|nr:Crp/Fnr family transcriptional regulator [Polaromonas sp.]
MSTEPPLHKRRRAPDAAELAGIPWLGLLLPAEREQAVDSLIVGDALPGDYVCRVGKPVTYWFGVVEGLLKMSSDNVQGMTMTFAGLPVDTFHWLLDHSIGFNRFVMNQLNERLGQFIAAREIDRMNNPDLRVARSLAALFNPVLYPGVGEI